MQNPLLDKDFLRELDLAHNKEIFARIILLSFDEYPLKTIEGRVTGGSINIDGASAVRRTCSLSMVAKEQVNVEDFYWGLKSKFKLEIGVSNNINSSYPDIIWFKQGLFICTSFSSTNSTNNFTININGKDKMCLLNGEVGGSFTSSIDFGTMETVNYSYVIKVLTDKTYAANKYYIKKDDKYVLDDSKAFSVDKTYYYKDATITYTKIPLYDIIKNMINVYGQEPFSNIVINNLEDYGVELLEYRGDENSPMYMLYNIEAGLVTNMTMNGLYQVYQADQDSTSNILTTPKEDYVEENLPTIGVGYLLKLADIEKYNHGVYYRLINTVEPYATAVYLNFTQLQFKGTLTEEIKNTENVEYSMYCLNEDFPDLGTKGNYVYYYRKHWVLIDTKIFIQEDTHYNKNTEPLVIGDNCYIPGDRYYIVKISTNETAGYRLTDLTYAGELVANVGETIVSILDKIKNMLGSFEYFYDLDGRFVFQRKRTYEVNSWNSIIKDEDNSYSLPAVASSSLAYSFENSSLVTSFANTPNLLNLRNDFSVWGSRTTINGGSVPIHMRYAIDDKPVYYKNYEGKIYTTKADLVNTIKEKKKQEIINDITDRIASFSFKYSMPDNRFIAPTKQEDGSWSVGWWDIRDWYEYYTLLKQESPNGTMKWYSHNNAEGCVRVNTLIPWYNPNLYSWLVAVQPDGTLILNHGASELGTQIRECTYYTSVLDENGKLITTKSSPPIIKDFITPYAWCSDDHTYLYFLYYDINTYGNQVLFYNPKFPDADSYKDAVNDQIDKEYDDYIKSGEINLVDWREIIYQMSLDYFQHYEEDSFLSIIAKNNIITEYLKDGPVTISYYPTGRTTYEKYYTDLQGFWRQIYDPSNESYKDYNFFNPDVTNAPEKLNFWFDFMNTYGDLGKYRILDIGDRTKSVNDNDVTAIYFRGTPTVLFVTPEEFINMATSHGEKFKTGYTYIQFPKSMESFFSISAQGKSAQDTLDSLLEQYTYCIETTTITALPVYYLEPNTRILVRDDSSGINGEYLISKITLPLTYNGTMSISATKAVDKIY